jgi:hypothetical protein
VLQQVFFGFVLYNDGAYKAGEYEQATTDLHGEEAIVVQVVLHDLAKE